MCIYAGEMRRVDKNSPPSMGVYLLFFFVLPSLSVVGCNAPQAMPLKTDDPMQFYTDMKKLGQGASGTVFVGTDVRTGEVSVAVALFSSSASPINIARFSLFLWFYPFFFLACFFVCFFFGFLAFFVSSFCGSGW